MPYHNMSMEDFARYLGMDAREVQKLAERGKLPGQKISGRWRFNSAQVTEWLQQEMPSLDQDRLRTLERSLDDASGGGEMIVTDLIGLEGVDVAFQANTRASVLRELVRLADTTGLLYDPDGLLAALLAREEMCSTALPNGVALPHPRQPMPYVSAEPLVCIARPTRGIGFGSPDGRLTRLFVMVCCHDDRHHLRVLARLMRLLDAETVSILMQVETCEELLAALIEKEEKVASTE